MKNGSVGFRYLNAETKSLGIFNTEVEVVRSI